MEFEGGAAVRAGVISGLIMIIPIYMGLVLMPAQMKMDILKLLGTMMLPLSNLTYPIGLMTHLAMSIAFGLIHVALFVAFDIEANLAAWGLLFGAVHAVISGTAFAIMPTMHVGIKNHTVEAPGFMALSLPRPTALGFLMVHMLYGVLVGTLYEVFI